MSAEPTPAAPEPTSSQSLGSAMSTRPLHVIWLLDRSGSMAADGKIQALNNAMEESVPVLRSAARSAVNAEVWIRVVTFGTGAEWHLEQPIPVSELVWQDIVARGHTDLGAALSLTAAVLETPPMPERALPPVLILVSDGRPTDDFGLGLNRLMRSRWGPRAFRLAVAIGRDADTDVLRSFIGDQPQHPVRADSPQELISAIRWASTALTEASQLRSGPLGGGPQPSGDHSWPAAST